MWAAKTSRFDASSWLDSPVITDNKQQPLNNHDTYVATDIHIRGKAIALLGSVAEDLRARLNCFISTNQLGMTFPPQLLVAT